MIKKKIPRYFTLRIYLVSSLLYLLLVLPFAGYIILQNLPALIDKKQDLLSGYETNVDSVDVFNDSKSEVDGAKNDSGFYFQGDANGITLSIRAPENKEGTKPDDNLNASNPLNTSLSMMFNMLLLSTIVGYALNYPMKRYFKRKRKGKIISDKLYKFAKKNILRVPAANLLILGSAYFITHLSMLIKLYFRDSTQSFINENLFASFFYISLFSSILTLLFVFFWEKHRVHIRYLEHVYTPVELRHRIFRFQNSRLINRFWISSAMTTLLPLTIVLAYMILSITKIRDLGIENISKDQLAILLGHYSSIPGSFGLDNGDSGFKNLFFFNAIDSFIMFVGIGVGIFVAFIYIILFIKWTTQDIVIPVNELLHNMQKTGEGKTTHYTSVRTNDEIGHLAEGFNIMSGKISNYIENISRTKEAYYRFVPKQFLDFLGKTSIEEVTLGDQVQQEMSVLFTDIRSFTTLSEQMTPKENFDFLNQYLGKMEPVISRNHGFVDKYIGDSIMALFPGRVEDAIDAAIEMRSALEDFNNELNLSGKVSIDSGIGLHTGNLMLGIVGGHGRMDSTVVSDAVNLASRIEGLTKIYGSSIIISQDTLIKLEDPNRYNYRFLDVVKVKGKNEAVYIFEILDGDPEIIKTLKIETKPQFGKAIQLYKNKSFAESLFNFEEIVSKNPDDMASWLYIERCKNILSHGLPTDWDGVETMKVKF